jgi:hypothetical protein
MMVYDEMMELEQKSRKWILFNASYIDDAYLVIIGETEELLQNNMTAKQKIN